MNRRGPPLIALALLLVAGALLAREIAAEAALILDPKPVRITPSEPTADSDGGARREPGFRMPPPERFASIAERPLFSSDRRPFEPPVEPQPEAAPPAPLRAVLQGIIGNRSERLALVAFDGKRRAERLSEGDTHGAWAVAEITADSVVLVRGDESVELRLGFATVE